ncbi:hypothetical protein D9619_009141 [Psilocybe cf. subviscida]|uniref:Uncharacterized protein n=1 Tax=Psilocybe cf. subviscida TaxID=2480587 RepID=A0A8H5FA70_9AGAR|nr:hypothetical protein D9619_009141 [Psilocybe cf. subviscida]
MLLDDVSSDGAILKTKLRRLCVFGLNLGTGMIRKVSEYITVETWGPHYSLETTPARRKHRSQPPQAAPNASFCALGMFVYCSSSRLGFYSRRDTSPLEPTHN